MNQFPAVDKNDRIIGFVVRDPQNKYFAWSYLPLEKTHPLITDASLADIKSQCQCIRRNDYQGTAFFSAITSMIVALFSNSTGISYYVCYQISEPRFHIRSQQRHIQNGTREDKDNKMGVIVLVVVVLRDRGSDYPLHYTWFSCISPTSATVASEHRDDGEGTSSFVHVIAQEVELPMFQRRKETTGRYPPLKTRPYSCTHSRS